MELRLAPGVLGRSVEELIEVSRTTVELLRDRGIWCQDADEEQRLRGAMAAMSYLDGQDLAPPIADGQCPPRSRDDVEQQIEAARRRVASSTGKQAQFAYGVFYTLRYAVGLDEIRHVLDVADPRRTFTSAA